MAIVIRSLPRVGRAGDGPPPEAIGFGRRTVVILARAEEAEYATHTAPLSIKTVLSGEERYEFGGVTRRVTPGRRLIINPATRYSSVIDSAAGQTRSLCVFFAAGEEARARAAFEAGGEAALNDWTAARPAEFAECIEAADGAAAGALAAAGTLAAAGADAVTLEEACTRLLAAMIGEHAVELDCAARRSPRRPAAQWELRRRLAVARDFIESAYEEPVTLDDIAAAARLSKHHLVRAFKARYGAPPSAFLRARRLDAAHERLARGEESVMRIALDCGYASHSAFSRAYRRRFGVAPREAARSSNSGAEAAAPVP